MVDFKRRTILKGIAALPIVVALQKLSFSAAPAAAQTITPAVTKLNVLLHGLMGIVIDPRNPATDVQLLIPSVEDNEYFHVYRAGTYKHSKDFAPLAKGRSYKLRGITPGRHRVRLDRSRNAVLSRSKAQIDIDRPGRGQRSWSIINLSFPGRLTSLRCIERLDGACVFSGMDSKILSHPRRLAAVHVLTYEVGQMQKPELYDVESPATPIWSAVSMSGTTIANPHIFAEPEKRPNVMHAVMAFQKMGDVFPKKSKTSNLELDFNIFREPNVVSSPLPCPDSLPKGVMAEDLWSLSERSPFQTNPDLESVNMNSDPQGAN